MSGFDQVLETAATAAQAHGTARQGDYLGPAGLLICGKCGTAKQCRVRIGGRERVVGCLCRCAEERREAEKRQLEESQAQLRRERRRRRSVMSAMLRDATFDQARPSELIRKAENYVKNWEMARENNVGLLLMGDVGVGKSYAAACICNALAEEGERCRMASFGQILNMGLDERALFMSRIHDYDLLVLDDLGIERKSDFADEIIFSVVDERYRCKKPLIVTTNLELGDLKRTGDVKKARVYDRLLEMCGPVRCKGESLRRESGTKMTETRKRVLSQNG